MALAISVSVQLVFHWHLHPSIDPSVHLKGGELGILAPVYDRQYSFPSDTTNLFMALSTVVFLENRILGWISMAWCIVLTGFVRIAIGCHYPSDIAGGVVLGVGSVLLVTHIKPLTHWFEGALKHSASRMYLVHAMFAFFLADAYDIFPGIIGILKTVKMVASARLK
jgi:membrane-associated phospholipid phosphatase